jgi:hypothetical protein
MTEYVFCVILFQDIFEYYYMDELYGAEIFPNRELITSDIEIVRSERAIDDLGHGAEGAVTRVTVIREGREEVMAFKEGYEQVSTFENNLIVRDILFNAGLPTLETYVLVFENGKAIGILMEDLTEGGRNFVLSSNEMKLIRYKLRDLVIKNYTLAAAIANIEDSEFEDSIPVLEEYAQVATSAGLQLAHVDFMFWVITPGGKVRPVIADLGTIKYKDIEEPEDLEEDNLAYFKETIKPLVRLRDLAIEAIQSCR